MNLKTSCDICGDPWTQDDVAEPKAIVRLKKHGDNTWVIVGFGSGMGQAFVHSRCLDIGKRVGNITGFGDAN